MPVSSYRPSLSRRFIRRATSGQRGLARSGASHAANATIGAFGRCALDVLLIPVERGIDLAGHQVIHRHADGDRAGHGRDDLLRTILLAEARQDAAQQPRRKHRTPRCG